MYKEFPGGHLQSTSEEHLPNTSAEMRRKAEKVYEETGTEKNYGALTWSNKQILCDTLQNSLDAETRKFVSKLEADHVVNAEEFIAKAADSPTFKGAYLDMLNLLYILSYRAGDLEQQEKNKLITRINLDALDIGVVLSNVDADYFKTSQRPDLPSLTYAVQDTKTGKVIRELSREDLSTAPYSDADSFPLFEWKVLDEGGGYDVTKSILYLPTKEGERFSRGVFGEGLKVNQAAIARTPGVKLRIHSQYEEEAGNSVAWVRHVQSEDDMVVQRGKNVRQQVFPGTGSGTTIRFIEQQDENKELQTVLDPRLTAVESVAVEFGETDLVYPLGVRNDGIAHPGVSLSDTSYQYLQGLRIGESGESLLFSYDFQNREILAGRDRNHLNRDVVRTTVQQFWEQVNDPALQQVFIQRLLFKASHGDTAERAVFFNACKRLLDGLNSSSDAVMLQELISSLKLQNNIPNYIAARGDGRISQIDPDTAHIVQLQMSCSEDEVSLIQKMLKENCPEFKFLHVSKETPGMINIEEEDEKEDIELTAEQQVFSEGFSELFAEVKSEYAPLMDVYSRAYETSRFAPDILYKINEYTEEIKFGVHVENRVCTITCHLPSEENRSEVTPDLTNQEMFTDMKAQALLLFLASNRISKGSFFSNHTSYKEYAQKTAQHLLDDVPRSASADNAPLMSLWGDATLLMNEQMKGIKAREKNQELENTVVAFKEEASHLSCTPERLLDIARWCVKKEHEDVAGSSSLFLDIYSRTVIKDNEAFFIKQDEKEVVLMRVGLNEGNRIGEWSGYPKHQIAEDRWVILVPTEENATLTRQFSASNTVTYAVCADTAVYIRTGDSVVANVFSHKYLNMKLDNGCISTEDEVCFHEGYIGEFVYSPVPQYREHEDMRIETGLVKSPVTLEYISAHWSDPERIFQDLGQNHLDAGGLEKRYLVVREEEQEWVDEADLGDLPILGYELSDRGLGYSPSGIHTMGHTRKRNPFLTGKNGEGLKLAAASAKKNGFDITFASFGEDAEGREVAWQADAQTLNEPYTHDGKTSSANRLCFEVAAHPREMLGDKSAVTRLVLPADADAVSHEYWGEWVASIDPRNKDDFENGGLDRILITHEGSQGPYNVVGPTTLLYERPGALFENGMLVRTTPQDERTFTLGWNFPSITSTRERTHINEDMAKAYIQHYFAHTTDERAVEHLLRSIQTPDIGVSSVNWSDGHFSEVVEFAHRHMQKTDVDASWALPYGSSYPSCNLFQQVAKRLYPDKTLFSYEYAQRYSVPMHGSMRHLREEQRLNVSMDDYEKLQHIFPTMEAYLHDVSTSKITIDPETLTPLRNLVGDEINRVTEALDRLEQNSSTAPILQHVLKKSDTSIDVLHERLDRLRPEASAGTVNDIFLMADDSNADGLASNGIGLKISLLRNQDAGRLFGVLDHELAHKMLEANDYSEEFILLLLLLAQDSLEQNKPEEPVDLRDSDWKSDAFHDLEEMMGRRLNS